MAVIDLVAHKSRQKLCGLAAGVTGPARKRLVEVDIEHDTAEIEQQCIGSAGGEQGPVHRGGVRKTGEGSNGVATPCWRNLQVNMAVQSGPTRAAAGQNEGTVFGRGRRACQLASFVFQFPLRMITSCQLGDGQ